MEGRTKDMMQLTGAFRNYANALNKTYGKERGYDDVHNLKLVQYCNTCRHLVNIAINLLLP
jgi:hypothetical protein